MYNVMYFLGTTRMTAKRKAAIDNKDKVRRRVVIDACILNLIGVILCGGGPVPSIGPWHYQL